MHGAKPRPYRPPFWDTDRHGEPAGRFRPTAPPPTSGAPPPAMDATTLRVLGSSNAADLDVPISSDLDVDAAWAKMRSVATIKRQQHHRAEGAAVMDAFAAACDFSPGAGPLSCTPAQFHRAWFSLGVKHLADGCVAEIFRRVGHDARGRMPVDVFVRRLVLGENRAIGKEAIRRGPFIDARDAKFLGKVRCPRSGATYAVPSDWLRVGERVARRSATAPAAALTLDFAHGFPGSSDKNMGNSLHVTPAGDVVYYLAALGVVYRRDAETRTHSQRFFFGHDDDVRSIAQHPDGVTFATGQDGHRPRACVWSAERLGVNNGRSAREGCAELARVEDPDGYMRAFVALAFSPDGRALLAVGADDKHTVTMWDWRKAVPGSRPIMSMPGIQAEPVAVHGAAFNPWTVRRREDGEEEAAPYHEFVTFGEKHVKVWRRRASDGRWAGKFASLATLDEPRPGYERETSRTFVAHCAAFLPGGDVLVGCGDGRLLAIDPETRRVRAESIRVAHAKPAGKPPSVRDERKREPKWGVAAMRVVNDGAEVVTAGADGRVLTWRVDERTGNDLDATPREEIALESPADGRSNRAPVIRALAVAGEPGPGRTEARTARTQTQKRQQTLRDAEGVSEEISAGGGRVVSPGKAAPPARPSSAAAAAISAAAARPWLLDGNATAPDAGRFPRKPRAPTPWALTDRGVEAEGPLEDGSEPKKNDRGPGISNASNPDEGSTEDVSKRRFFYVGTSVCDVWRVDRDSARVLVGGPGAGRPLHAVAWNPRAPSVCASVGASGEVKVWDASRRSRLVARVLGPGATDAESRDGFVGRSVAFSPDGRLLAVGAADGRVVVLDARTLADVARAQAGSGGAAGARRLESVPGARVDALAFSPDATRLAVAGGDRLVRVFANVGGAFAPVARCAGHSATVTALDWSVDGEVLRSCCANDELLYWRAARGFERMFSGGETGRGGRDAAWATHTARAGFATMGVWEEGGVGAPTPRVVTLDRANGGGHVAVGDDLGRVRLLHYPCVVKNAPGRTARAHGGSVAAVRFSADDEWLAAAGGADGALMMWRTSGMEGAKKTPTLEGPIR